jgi:hypothetical protein
MQFEGERLIETGVEASYLEIWERLPQSLGGTAALELIVDHGELASRPSWLLVAGACFMFVRGRARPLPHAADLSGLITQARPPRAQLVDWLDVEISFGHRTGPTPWRIEHSTLPFREGQVFTQPGDIQRRSPQVAIEDHPERRWRILDWNLGATL